MNTRYRTNDLRPDGTTVTVATGIATPGSLALPVLGSVAGSVIPKRVGVRVQTSDPVFVNFSPTAGLVAVSGANCGVPLFSSDGIVPFNVEGDGFINYVSATSGNLFVTPLAP